MGWAVLWRGKLTTVIRNLPTGAPLADERATSRRTDITEAIREGADYRPLTVGTYSDGGGKRVFQLGSTPTVALLQAVVNLIPHGLSGEPQGWIVTDVDAFTTIRRVASPDDTRWLALETQFTCTARLEVR